MGLGQILSGAAKQGGFFDRMANPTNGLGMLGQALLMGSGGPIGNAFQSLYAMNRAKVQDARELQNQELDRQYKQAEIQHLLTQTRAGRSQRRSPTSRQTARLMLT